MSSPKYDDGSKEEKGGYGRPIDSNRRGPREKLCAEVLLPREASANNFDPLHMGIETGRSKVSDDLCALPTRLATIRCDN